MDCIQCGTHLESLNEACAQCGWHVDAVVNPVALKSVTLAGRYQLGNFLGEGRLGAVFVANDLESGHHVALKVMHQGLIPDDGIGGEFLGGMRPLMNVTHPVMTRILDVNHDAGRYFVVSELLEGVPLRDLIDNRRAQGRSFTVNEIHTIVRQIVAFLVESGIEFHGSLSPDNVWILPQTLKVLDAGQATSLPRGAVGHRLGAGYVAGRYVAPEIVKGKHVSTRSDVYSIGVLVGEMLTQASFDGRPGMFREADADLPEEIDSILMRALLVDPRGRFLDTEELLSDISELAGLPPPTFNKHDTASGSTPVRAPKPRRTPPKKKTGSGLKFGIQGVPEATVQVSMEDVIRAHMDSLEEVRTSKAAPPPRRVSSIPPPPPPRRVSSIPPPPLPSSKATLPPPPMSRKVGSLPDRQPHHAPAFLPDDFPPLDDLVPKSEPIVPKRPSPRESVPPPSPARRAAPPKVDRLNMPVNVDDDESTSVGKRSSAPPDRIAPSREVTQEIDIDAIEAMEEVQQRREVTQEIDASMLQMEEASTMEDAVANLVSRTRQAERESTEELVKHADRLEGVNPRFVRAAHKLEVEKRGGDSREAVEVRKEPAADAEGINPRFLRAAAKLEDAKISEVPITGLHEVEKIESETSDEDWRKRIGTSKEDSVISFIVPPVVTRSSEVIGFPRSQQRSVKKGAPAPPLPPRRPAARASAPTSDRRSRRARGDNDD